MKKELFYETSAEEWSLENRLNTKGYVKISDCYWTQIFVKGNNKIILSKKAPF